MFDLSRIAAESFVRSIDFHDSLGSTNDRALELAIDPGRSTPCLVLAQRQTGGRGRGANSWWSSEGSLTFSVLVDGLERNLPAGNWPLVSLAAGLAVCEALDAWHVDRELKLKWPNDVFLDGRKVSGLLVEIPDPKLSRLVIGIGINVNNSFETAPTELRAIATAMSDVESRTFELTDVLIRVLTALDAQLRCLEQSSATLRERWSRRSLLTGRIVTLRHGNEEAAGRCLGIDGEGALLLETASGVRAFRSGVVVRYDSQSVEDRASSRPTESV